MNKPPWDFSEQGKVLMHEWLNSMIGDTPYGVEAFLEANNTVEVLRAFFGQIEPPKRLIERLAAGNPGDVRPVGEGVSELRIDYGPGYRVYFAKRGREVVLLLAGGDKTTQSADIKIALRLSRNL